MIMLILGVNINQVMKRDSPLFTEITKVSLLRNLYLGVLNTKIGLRNIFKANADIDNTAN